MIEVGYLGRALSLRPAGLGEIFHSTCTVSRTTHQTEWVKEEDAITGEVTSRPVTRRVHERIPLFWYAEDAKGERLFCTYSGFGPKIVAELRRLGHADIRVRELVDDGLGRPDLSQLQGLSWRRNQKSVFAKLLAHRRGIVVCSTGFGKSFMCRALAKAYPDAKIIITIPSGSADVAKRFYSSLADDLGYTNVGLVGYGSRRIRRITVASGASLHKLPKDANLILADECHAFSTERYVKVFNKFHRARIFGFTATEGKRGDRADDFGRALFGPVIADIGYQESVAGGNVVQIRVRMYRVTEGPRITTDHKITVDRRGLWDNGARNRRVVEAVREAEAEVGPDAQILIMVDTIEHAYLLGQLLPEYVIVSGVPQPDRVAKLRRKGVITPDQQLCTDEMRTKYRKAFEANELKRAISTKVWTQGVDFTELAVLVRADGAASGIDAGQIPGRLSRLSETGEKECGLLIDFVDEFTPQLHSRSIKRVKEYQTVYGWEVSYR